MVNGWRADLGPAILQWYNVRGRGMLAAVRVEMAVEIVSCVWTKRREKSRRKRGVSSLLAHLTITRFCSKNIWQGRSECIGSWSQRDQSTEQCVKMTEKDEQEECGCRFVGKVRRERYGETKRSDFGSTV
jgi:hypothetical protein